MKEASRETEERRRARARRAEGWATRGSQEDTVSAASHVISKSATVCPAREGAQATGTEIEFLWSCVSAGGIQDGGDGAGSGVEWNTEVGGGGVNETSKRNVYVSFNEFTGMNLICENS